MNYLKSRTVWAVAAALLLVGAQWFTGNPLDMDNATSTARFLTELLTLAAVLFARFKKAPV